MTGVIVKICGVTTAQGGAACARAGVDWIGLNFWPSSKRVVERAQAVDIAAAIREARPGVQIVGVFVNEDPVVVEAIAEQVGLDQIQLHGDEPAIQVAALGERGIKAVCVREPADLERLTSIPEAAAVLLDAPALGYGGSGTLADWELARRAVQSGRRVILAGGLTPDNVAEAIAVVRPWGVDVASGVEIRPGIKDPDRVKAFVKAAKS